MPDINLMEALLPLKDTDEDNITRWAAQYEVKLKRTGNGMYKVLNGCIKNIMFYPNNFKLMFQDGGKNSVITSLNEENIIALIKGDVPYKPTCEYKK
jgi:hypothetical protein